MTQVGNYDNVVIAQPQPLNAQYFQNQNVLQQPPNPMATQEAIRNI